MIKCFASDIDHTLYCSETNRIPPRNVEAIQKLYEKGITVILASSRYAKGTKDFARELGLYQHQGYIVALNGSYVLRCADNQVIQNECFSEEQLHELYQESQRIGCSFQYWGEAYKVTNAYTKIVDYDFNLVDGDIIVTHYPFRYLKGPVSQCAFCDDQKGARKLYEEIDPKLRAKYNFNCSQDTVIDVSLAHVNKKMGLEAAMRDLGISYAEMACTGDGDNDVPMLESCCLSGCVANGSPKAKAAAKVQLASDDEAGVADFIEKYLL